VIEADFVNATKDTTESQEEETPEPNEASATPTEEQAADTGLPGDAKDDKESSALGFTTEKATQTSVSAPTNDPIGKAEGTNDVSKAVDHFRSRLFLAALLGCLDILAIVTLVLTWVLKSPSPEGESSTDDANASSSSDSESKPSVDELKPSPCPAYYCPLLHPQLPSSSLPNPSPSTTQDGQDPPWEDLLKEDSNNIVLGLRVYTQTEDPVKIAYRLGGENSG
jgi:hypothetical protein